MGNYIESILTYVTSKKYRPLIDIFSHSLFGPRIDHSKKIRTILQNKGVTIYAPFYDKKVARISLFSYKDPYVKKTIRDLKFKYNKRYCDLYSDLVTDVILEEISELALTHNFTNPLMCMVPSHSRTIRKRNGYYSTKILASQIYLKLHDPSVTLATGLIVKKRNTAQQSRTKNKKERLKNPKGAFRIKRKNLITDRNILLVDDVYTTGATMNECTKILLQAGARRVLQITIAS